MYPRLVVIAVVFVFFSFPIQANTQRQASELARCLVHDYGCVGKVASELSNAGSPGLKKQVFDAIEAELRKAPVDDRHRILKKLLYLKTEEAYLLFWNSVRKLDLDFEQWEGDMESDASTFFNQGFQSYTLRQIESRKDFALAGIYFDLLHFYNGSS